MCWDRLGVKQVKARPLGEKTRGRWKVVGAYLFRNQSIKSLNLQIWWLAKLWMWTYMRRFRLASFTFVSATRSLWSVPSACCWFVSMFRVQFCLRWLTQLSTCTKNVCRVWALVIGAHDVSVCYQWQWWQIAGGGSIPPLAHGFNSSSKHRA